MHKRLSFQDIVAEEHARLLREANDCHTPAGSPQGGQFCSKGSSGGTGGGAPKDRQPGRVHRAAQKAADWFADAAIRGFDQMADKSIKWYDRNEAVIDAASDLIGKSFHLIPGYTALDKREREGRQAARRAKRVAKGLPPDTDFETANAWGKERERERDFKYKAVALRDKQSSASTGFKVQMKQAEHERKLKTDPAYRKWWKKEVSRRLGHPML